MKVYISGPITGQNNYRERFAAAEELLKKSGYEPINPAEELAEMPKNTTHKEYMEKAIALLACCEGIYMLEGWENSKGARIEFEYAAINKLTICFERRAGDE